MQPFVAHFRCACAHRCLPARFQTAIDLAECANSSLVLPTLTFVQVRCAQLVEGKVMVGKHRAPFEYLHQVVAECALQTRE